MAVPRAVISSVRRLATNSKRHTFCLMTKPQPKPDDPVQFARFKQAAKAAGVSENAAETFDDAFKKIAPAKLPPKGRD